MGRRGGSARAQPRRDHRRRASPCSTSSERLYVRRRQAHLHHEAREIAGLPLGRQPARGRASPTSGSTDGRESRPRRSLEVGSRRHLEVRLVPAAGSTDLAARRLDQHRVVGRRSRALPGPRSSALAQRLRAERLRRLHRPEAVASRSARVTDRPVPADARLTVSATGAAAMTPSPRSRARAPRRRHRSARPSPAAAPRRARRPARSRPARAPSRPTPSATPPPLTTDGIGASSAIASSCPGGAAITTEPIDSAAASASRRPGEERSPGDLDEGLRAAGSEPSPEPAAAITAVASSALRQSP